MRTIPLAIALGLILAACASEEIPPLAPQPPPAAEVAPAPAISRPPAASRDQCGASELQWLVGKPRAEIPVPLHPERQRVACSACPVTQDYNPGRLDIFFDASSGLVTEVRCG